jgi:hypothetical protein
MITKREADPDYYRPINLNDNHPLELKNAKLTSPNAVQQGSIGLKDRHATAVLSIAVANGFL